MPSVHDTLMGRATAARFAVQAEDGRLRLRPPGGKEWLPIRATIGAIEVQQDEQQGAQSITFVAVEVCAAYVSADAADALGANVPNDDWQAELDGAWWPIDRVGGVGTQSLTLHLKRAARKRLGQRNN
jgi:hypothetical protein